MKNIPEHVAIIMDGNRRWAKEKGLPAMIGHREGVKSVERVLKWAGETGVKILTLYTFSTENWKRPKKEVDFLIRLLENYLNNKMQDLNKNNIRLMTIGRIDRFSQSLHEKIEKVKDLTKGNSGVILNLALDYGGRDEIINATGKIAKDVLSGKVNAKDISEDLFSKYLYTNKLPDPDLLIRTGGEFRVSNFLLWQISYSELYITKKLWPDFTKKDFEKAVSAYTKRDRRQGA